MTQMVEISDFLKSYDKNASASTNTVETNEKRESLSKEIISTKK